MWATEIQSAFQFKTIRLTTDLQIFAIKWKISIKQTWKGGFKGATSSTADFSNLRWSRRCLIAPKGKKILHLKIASCTNVVEPMKRVPFFEDSSLLNSLNCTDSCYATKMSEGQERSLCASAVLVDVYLQTDTHSECNTHLAECNTHQSH